MAYHDFIPYVTKGIVVKFKCLNCSDEIEEEISVPWPDMESDDIGVEDTIENGSIQCLNCEKEYSYSIVSYGDFEIADLEYEEVNFSDIFYGDLKSDQPSDEIILLQKWNSRLLLKEPSKKFIDIILNKDSSKDVKTIRKEWFNEKRSSKDSFFKEPSSASTVYTVQTFSGRDLLIYYIKDDDIQEFEKDMKRVWNFLEDCYDEEWWVNEYGESSERDVLLLKKSKFIIAVHHKEK
jgi:hypothetical protein